MKKITIKDKVYGIHTITDSVLIELLKSRPVLRLKKICQYGIPDRYYHKRNFSRYEHSVGVMILIKIMGGSLEEQIAGLLHDVSHTAFSHVIDWVIGEAGDETYQDNRHEDIVNSGEIKKIVEKYNYNPKRISNYHNFGLLERNAPSLCADRVDYALRELSPTVSKPLLKHLINRDNEIMFANEKSAYNFAINFLKMQREHWGGYEAGSRYRLFSQALRLGLREGDICLKDFHRDDSFVVSKLLKTKNPVIKNILRVLSKKKLPFISKKSEIVFKKFRHTDPKFVDNGVVYVLSNVSSKYKDFFEKQKLHNKKGIKVTSSTSNCNTSI